jgi:hypothetical protein
MNDLFGGNDRIAELEARVEALESLIYQSQKTERVKVEEPLNEAWQRWNQYRQGKKWTARAKELSMKTLRELAGADGELALRIVNRSIELGYTGLFKIPEPKNSGNGGWAKPEPKQIHKTVQEALAPTESKEEARRNWEAQQRMYGFMK